MPGDASNFQQYRIDENQDGTDDVPDNASFGDADARFHWFKDDMLPAWESWRQTHSSIDVQALLKVQYKQ